MSIRQSDLRRELGVTAATVSKMVRALEKLGLVGRIRAVSTDRRQVHLTLTEMAKKLLRAIQRRVIGPGYLWLAIYSALSFDHTCDGQDVGALKSHLDRFRREWGDRAKLYFPWCDRTLSPKKPRKLHPRYFRLAGAD
jgi:DNA-binding MarR family transcriptional regulator